MALRGPRRERAFEAHRVATLQATAIQPPRLETGFADAQAKFPPWVWTRKHRDSVLRSARFLGLHAQSMRRPC